MFRVTVVGASPRAAREAASAAVFAGHERPMQGARADTHSARRLQRATMVAAVARETIWRERHA
jgi:hypothetical protein